MNGTKLNSRLYCFQLELVSSTKDNSRRIMIQLTRIGIKRSTDINIALERESPAYLIIELMLY